MRVDPHDERYRALLRAIDLANVVRKVGGFKPVNDLVPGWTGRSESCVLANTFNCDCRIWCKIGSVWYASFAKEEYAEALAKELGVEVEPTTNPRHLDHRYAVELPRDVGEIAAMFDLGALKMYQLIPRD